jgi:Leucine-rich repeat (LRR) protein
MGSIAPFMVVISNTYTVFPIVPVSYLSVSSLNLQNNIIPSLGDLTNLANLSTFSLRNNLITELTPQLGCVLTKCRQMDFSYNRLETVSFENFVCYSNTSSLSSNNLYVFSSLQALMLTGNLIKVKKYISKPWRIFDAFESLNRI